MAISWPVTLPYVPERDGYQVQQLGSPVIKSEMNSGRVRMRRQVTVDIATVAWSRYFTPAELGIFRPFVRQTLQSGTAEFSMPIWDSPSQTFITRMVQIKDGIAGITEVETAPQIYKVAFALLVQGLV
jgi:hypothetical protein